MSSLGSILNDISVWDVLAWRRPVLSGISMVALLALWVTFVLCRYTLTTFVSRIASLVFLVGAVGAITKRFELSPEDLSASLDRMYENLRPIMTRMADYLVHMITWRDFQASTRMFILTFVGAFVGNYMSDSTIVLFCIILAYTLPAVYERYHSEIDGAVNRVMHMTDQYVNMARGNPPAKKSMSDHVEHALHEMDRKAR